MAVVHTGTQQKNDCLEPVTYVSDKEYAAHAGLPPLRPEDTGHVDSACAQCMGQVTWCHGVGQGASRDRISEASHLTRNKGVQQRKKSSQFFISIKQKYLLLDKKKTGTSN